MLMSRGKKILFIILVLFLVAILVWGTILSFNLYLGYRESARDTKIKENVEIFLELQRKHLLSAIGEGIATLLSLWGLVSFVRERGAPHRVGGFFFLGVGGIRGVFRGIGERDEVQI